MIKSERLGVRVTSDTKKKLEDICKAESRSISNLICMIIERYLQENSLSR